MNERQAKQAVDSAMLEKKEPLLKNLKGLYREARSWPVRIEGAPQTQEQVERLIVETHDSVKRARDRVSQHEVKVKKVEASLASIEQALRTLRKERTLLMDKLADVKLQQDLKDLGNLRTSVSTVLNTALAVDSDEASNLNSDDLLLLQKDSPGSDSAFSDIMRE